MFGELVHWLIPVAVLGATAPFFAWYSLADFSTSFTGPVPTGTGPASLEAMATDYDRSGKADTAHVRDLFAP